MERPNWEPNDDGSHSLVLGATGFSARVASQVVRGKVEWWWQVFGPNIPTDTFARVDSADEAIDRAEEHLKMEFDRLQNEMNEVKRVFFDNTLPQSN